MSDSEVVIILYCTAVMCSIALLLLISVTSLRRQIADEILDLRESLRRQKRWISRLREQINGPDTEDSESPE